MHPLHLAFRTIYPQQLVFCEKNDNKAALVNPFSIPTWVKGVIFQGASLLFDLGKKSDSGFLFLCDCCEIDRSSGKCLMAETFEHKSDWFIKMLLFIVWFIYWPFFASQFMAQCQRRVKLKWLKGHRWKGLTLELWVKICKILLCALEIVKWKNKKNVCAARG